MKLLSVTFKLAHTPDEFPEAPKALFTQHFQVHGYNTRNKNDLHATHYHKKLYAPHRFFPDCTKTACSRLMKLSDL